MTPEFDLAVIGAGAGGFAVAAGGANLPGKLRTTHRRARRMFGLRRAA